MKIILNDRVAFATCRSAVQCCVFCGRTIGTGVNAVRMNNNSDELSIKKNLWLHIGCIESFHKCLRAGEKKHGKQLVMGEI